MTSQTKLITQGAEANIYLKDDLIIKHRIKKTYRIKQIDEKLRTRRTRAETKILTKVSQLGLAPKPLEQKTSKKKSDKIILPYISGKKLSQHLNIFPLKKQKQIIKKISLGIGQIHNQDIIHGDLTTSNMILTKENKIIFIDFGLGFHSSRYEDKAVDLHLFKQALEAKHFTSWQSLFKEFLKFYQKTAKNSEKILSQFKKVEKRGRYKH